MSAPMTKGQIAFELPKLSYVDTRWEEPAIEIRPTRKSRFSAWVAAFRAWRERSRALDEMSRMSDRELLDVGLSRGDLVRMFDDRYNQDLRARDAVR